jgi:hypothetical protein
VNELRARRRSVSTGRRATRLAALLASAAAASMAWAQIDVPSGLADVHPVGPGDVVEGSVRLANGGPTDRTVTLTLRDYRVRPGGDGWLDAGTLPRSAASWIDVPSVVRLGPDETRDVAYRLRVPEAGVDGTYWATLMVRPRPEGATAGAEERTAVGLRPVRRYAVQIVVDVGGAARPRLELGDAALDREGDAVTLDLEVHNDGARWVRRPTLEVRVVDPTDGEVLTTTRTGVRSLYPGAGTRVRTVLGALPSRPLHLLALARDDARDVVAVRFDLDPPDAP